MSILLTYQFLIYCQNVGSEIKTKDENKIRECKDIKCYINQDAGRNKIYFFVQ